MVPDIIVNDAEWYLTEEQLTTVEQMASCNYTAQSIAVYLSVPVDWFLAEFHDSESEIYRRYYKGKLQTDFEINNKLRQGAINGNITQTQQFEKHKRSIHVQNLKNKYFG